MSEKTPDEQQEELDNKDPLELSDKLLNEQSDALDYEFKQVLSGIVHKTVEDVTAETVTAGKVIGKKAAEHITQEIVVRLHDKVNTLGTAFLQKEIYRRRKHYFEHLDSLASGYLLGKSIVEENYIGKDGQNHTKQVAKKIYKIPPNFLALKQLLSYIDGTRTKVTAKQKKEAPSSLDEELIKSG